MSGFAFPIYVREEFLEWTVEKDGTIKPLGSSAVSEEASLKPLSEKDKINLSPFLKAFEKEDMF